MLPTASVSAAVPEHPNIVFIFIDDMGYADPSCFGNPLVETPNIDRLAREGVRLTNFYVNSPICSPSRVAVTTGQYPHRWRIFSYLASSEANAQRQMSNFLCPQAPSFARWFQDHGYATAHFGKWHMGGGRDVGDAPLPAQFGFDETLVAFEGLGDRVLMPGNLSRQSKALGQGEITHAPKHELTEIYVERSIDFIRRHRDGPFLLRMFPNDVHDAHVPEPGSEEKWAEVTDNPFEQKFFAVLVEMDRQIGRLIDELDRLGLTEKTLIVFTSDNGPTDWPHYYKKGFRPPGFTGPFYGRKWSLYEGGIRMPLIARWPGVIPQGVTNDRSVVCGIDLPPTFCNIANVPVPADRELDGYDMTEALFGKPIARPGPVFWQYGPPHAKLMPGHPEFVSPSLAVRDGRWKLLANPDGNEAQLYDLESDPGETNNLLQEHPRVAQQLWRKIREWTERIDRFDFEITTDRLTPPQPAMNMEINGEPLHFENTGVEVTESEKCGHKFTFSGKGACLDLPREQAPALGGKPVRVAVTVEAVQGNGTVMAHGGNRMGYSLHLHNGHPCFTTCVDWERTTIASEKEIALRRPHRLEARLKKDGTMVLSINGEEVARDQAPGPIPTTPGDSLQIGADLIQPVGDYDPPHYFTGSLEAIEIEYGE